MKPFIFFTITNAIIQDHIQCSTEAKSWLNQVIVLLYSTTLSSQDGKNSWERFGYFCVLEGKMYS